MDYILLDDTIHGAAIMCKTELYRKYLGEAIDRVKYAEDCLYRLMIFDKCTVHCYSENVIFYEYGSGISTKGNERWKRIIHNDLETTDLMLFERAQTNYEKTLISNAIAIRDNKKIAKAIRLLRYPRLFIKYLIFKTFERKTEINITEKECEYLL